MSLTIKSIRAVAPLLDRVLVQRLQPSQKTASGIFLPASATEKNSPEAQVIAVGPGARDKKGNAIPTSVKTGDKVLLPSFGGQTIKVGEEEYTLLRDSEILAVLTE